MSQTEQAKARAADPYFAIAMEARQEARERVNKGVIPFDQEKAHATMLMQIGLFDRCQYLEWQLKQRA